MAQTKEQKRGWYLRHRERHLERTRLRHATKRETARKFLADWRAKNPCVDCGESDPVVLDFDHMGDKAFGLSQSVALLKSIEKIKEEIAKCEIRCANCHRRKTHRDRLAIAAE